VAKEAGGARGSDGDAHHARGAGGDVLGGAVEFVARCALAGRPRTRLPDTAALRGQGIACLATHVVSSR
jgi:hypothetical protein